MNSIEPVKRSMICAAVQGQGVVSYDVVTSACENRLLEQIHEMKEQGKSADRAIRQYPDMVTHVTTEANGLLVVFNHCIENELVGPITPKKYNKNTREDVIQRVADQFHKVPRPGHVDVGGHDARLMAEVLFEVVMIMYRCTEPNQP